MSIKAAVRGRAIMSGIYSLSERVAVGLLAFGKSRSATRDNGELFENVDSKQNEEHLESEQDI